MFVALLLASAAKPNVVGQAFAVSACVVSRRADPCFDDDVPDHHRPRGNFCQPHGTDANRVAGEGVGRWPTAARFGIRARA
jgi:hypothetical protein